MKKRTAAVITAALVCAQTAAVVADGISVVCNGERLAFDTEPIIVEGRTLVPLRKIFEALGAEVEWNDTTKTVTAKKNEREIELTIGKAEMRVNDKTIALDTAAMIVNDRTLVPVRAVSEGMGASVDWDDATKTVLISQTTAATASTPEPTATAAPQKTEWPIEYDRTGEDTTNSVRSFELTSCEKTADGNYRIGYKLKTFKEGRGYVDAYFECYDADGNMIGTFGGVFMGTDYTWSDQKAEATISGKTTKIRLMEGLGDD